MSIVEETPYGRHKLPRGFKAAGHSGSPWEALMTGQDKPARKEPKALKSGRDGAEDPNDINSDESSDYDVNLTVESSVKIGSKKSSKSVPRIRPASHTQTQVSSKAKTLSSGAKENAQKKSSKTSSKNKSKTKSTKKTVAKSGNSKITKNSSKSKKKSEKPSTEKPKRITTKKSKKSTSKKQKTPQKSNRVNKGEKSDDSMSSRNPLKVSNQLTASRRKEIELALEDKSGSPKGWSRSTGVKQHRILRKRIKPGQIRTISFPLLESRMGNDWPTRLTVIHGARPGPVVTILGAIHGDELVGPLALTHLLGSTFIGPGRPLDPEAMAGTIRIVPVVNLPGYRMHTRYFPDGRDLNRAFPGNKEGNTTSRVAHRVWNELVSKSDYVIDLHSAARGRTNLPQVRADLAHPKSNMLARSFGIEVILDSSGPRGSLRRVSNEHDVGYVTYEGGGANTADSEALQVAIHGILNSLRNLHVISGNPSRPRFRLLAAGSIWLRADEGGLLDVITPAGRFVERHEVVATITDPERPGAIVSLTTPEAGLLICTATNPYVNAGSPVGHLLPINRGVKTVVSRLDSDNRLVVSGIDGDPPWREEAEVDEITVDGAWLGGHIDAEWQSERGTGNSGSEGVLAEEEADEA